MNYALIFAGGVGKRMNAKGKPKQFLEIHGKPILIHTIEHFENHPDIDEICIVCVEEWIAYTKSILQKNNINKVRWLVAGGETALESQYNGLSAICGSKTNFEGDIVLIHDGVRPLINEKVISNCIETVKLYGSAVTIAPAIETIICTTDEGKIASTIPRNECSFARAPQAFLLNEIVDSHERSRKEGKYDYIDSVSLMLHHNYKIHTVEGPMENIKVTSPTDFYICRALLDARENSQIFGL